MATPFSNKCQILGEFWISYKDDESFAPFFQYNDLGLPLAYFIAEDMVVGVSEQAEAFIEETWSVFAGALGLDEDKEWESLQEIFETVPETVEE